MTAEETLDDDDIGGGSPSSSSSSSSSSSKEAIALDHARREELAPCSLSSLPIWGDFSFVAGIEKKGAPFQFPLLRHSIFLTSDPPLSLLPFSHPGSADSPPPDNG